MAVQEGKGRSNGVERSGKNMLFRIERESDLTPTITNGLQVNHFTRLHWIAFDIM